MVVKILWKQRKAAFRYPLGRTPRTAILLPAFRSEGREWNGWVPRWLPRPMFLLVRCHPLSGPVRLFPGGWDASMEAFAPHAVVATCAQLLQRAGDAELATRAAPTHAVIAVSRLGEPLLTTAQRDQLWRAFEVPLFQQVIGPRGRLLAAECEAHDGLHSFSADTEAQELLHAFQHCELVTARCACGQTTPRIRPKQPFAVDPPAESKAIEQAAAATG